MRLKAASPRPAWFSRRQYAMKANKKYHLCELLSTMTEELQNRLLPSLTFTHRGLTIPLAFPCFMKTLPSVNPAFQTGHSAWPSSSTVEK